MSENKLIKSLVDIQSRLKAPKSQMNNFGGYKYRNCEDILEAVKPLLKENSLILTISDEIVEISGRFYVKATATLTDGENQIATSALAREEESKKGMDGSQLTGASSSYARKYALNGLFCIDDTKDSDTTNTGDAPWQSDIEKAKKLIRQAKTLEGLKKIYDMSSGEIQQDRAFLEALSSKKKEILDAAHK
jgi:hypothetical protein